MAKDNDKALYEKAKKKVQLRQTAMWFVYINVICWAVYLITGAGSNIWPLWVTFGTGAWLMASYFSYSSSTFSVESEYEKLKKK